MGIFSHTAIADICDYRPSKKFNEKIAIAVAGAPGAAVATGTGMKAAGFYIFPHATAGMMLGSTAAGTSAAGTVGIIAGTGGVIGSIGAALMSPFVIIPAAITAVGVGVYEGGCYLSEEQSRMDK